MVLVTYWVAIEDASPVQITVKVKGSVGSFIAGHVYDATTEKLGHKRWRPVGFTMTAISVG